MRIVIFTDFLSPIEHLHGLLIIAAQTSELEAVTVFGKLKSDVNNEWIELLGDRLHHFSDASYSTKVRKIAKCDIVFGIPNDFLWMRFLSAAKALKFIPYFFGPGFVTKAVGYFKHPEKGSWPAFKTMIKFRLLNTHFVCSNETDRIYLAAALGYPLERTISAHLPKHVFMNNALAEGDAGGRRTGILFAPTHRWDDIIPPLTELMADSDFIDALTSKGFDIFHSRHPETAEAPLDTRVCVFDRDWSKVACVVTDYSSIGEDFILSGGSHVISYMVDQLDFVDKQGVGPLFNYSMSKKVIVRDIAELDSALDEVGSTSDSGALRRNQVDDYFWRLLLKNARRS
jgi:hypothetical protein